MIVNIDHIYKNKIKELNAYRRKSNINNLSTQHLQDIEGDHWQPKREDSHIKIYCKDKTAFQIMLIDYWAYGDDNIDDRAAARNLKFKFKGNRKYYEEEYGISEEDLDTIESWLERSRFCDVVWAVTRTKEILREELRG